MNENQLLQGNLRAALIRFAIPFLGASLLQFLYGAVDMVVVGKFCNPAAIVAVSNGAQVMQILTLMVVGFTTGVTVLVGQFLGSGRRADMERTFTAGVCLYAGLALVLLLLLLLFHQPLIRVMQVPGAAVPQACRYLLICSLGIPFIVGYNLISATLRAIGDSKHPMIFVALTCLFNIAADLLLVGLFQFGVAGAAAATLASQVLCFLLSLSVLRRPEFPFSRTPFRPSGSLALRLLRIGGPLGLQNLLVELSFLLITVIVNRIGLEQAAAVGIVERILAIGFMGASSFSSAISAMTAQNIGAGQPRRAYQAATFGILCSVGLGGVLYVLFLLFSHQLIGIFTPDSTVIYHGSLYITLYGSDCVLVGLVFCLNGFFNGCGKTTFTMVNSLLSTFLIRVPLSYFISLLPAATMLHMGIAAPAASLVQILIQLLYLRSGRWNQNSLDTH